MYLFPPNDEWQSEFEHEKDLIAELNQIKQTLHSKYPSDKESYQGGKAFFYNRRG
jgi:hypothetical protein